MNLITICGLILLQSELFLMVISCKTVNSSMKLKFIHKMAVIHDNVLLNLLRGPDIASSGAGFVPQVVHPCYNSSEKIYKEKFTYK